MSGFTLHNTPYPDGTTVYAYDATGYATGFPGANPPGDPVSEATASERTVEFSGLTVGTPYFAAAQISGKWHYIGFTPEAPSSVGLAELLETSGKGFRAWDPEIEEWPERPNFASVENQGPAEAGEPPESIAGDTWIEE